MHDNAVIKINMSIAPKMETAISHEYSVPMSISICGSPRGDGSNATVNCRVFAAQSWSTTLSSEEWTDNFPLYSMKPNFRNLFIKKLTRDRVVPIISASVS